MWPGTRETSRMLEMCKPNYKLIYYILPVKQGTGNLPVTSAIILFCWQSIDTLRKQVFCQCHCCLVVHISKHWEHSQSTQMVNSDSARSPQGGDYQSMTKSVGLPTYLVDYCIDHILYLICCQNYVVCVESIDVPFLLLQHLLLSGKLPDTARDHSS